MWPFFRWKQVVFQRWRLWLYVCDACVKDFTGIWMNDWLLIVFYSTQYIACFLTNKVLLCSLQPSTLSGGQWRRWYESDDLERCQSWTFWQSPGHEEDGGKRMVAKDGPEQPGWVLLFEGLVAPILIGTRLSLYCFSGDNLIPYLTMRRRWSWGWWRKQRPWRKQNSSGSGK